VFARRRGNIHVGMDYDQIAGLFDCVLVAMVLFCCVLFSWQIRRTRKKRNLRNRNRRSNGIGHRV
jgi:hypothetical protein